MAPRSETEYRNDMEIRDQISELFSGSPEDETPAIPADELITVSPATKRVAFAYERFRNTLEPDEEDILRRRAIARILERRLAEDRPPVTLAEQLLQELIRANYISQATQRFAAYLGERLRRAQQIRAALNEELDEWFLNIVATSIDRAIFPRRQEEAFVRLMYQDAFKRTEWVDDLVAGKDRPTQLYMACHRALFEADDHEIAYHYFIHHFPNWYQEEFTDADANHIIRELPQFYERIQAAVNHPARDRLVRLLRPAAVPYRIARDVAHEQPQALESADSFTQAAREAVGSRLRRLRSRMNRRAWHSILFLFFTKTIIAFLIEVPYEAVLLSELHTSALIINITFHPILLFFLATTTRLPGSKNTDLIVEQATQVITGEGNLPTIVIRRTRSYGALTWTVFALIYAVLFLLIFWGLFSLLDALQFSLVAMFMFVMFLGLVSFLAIRIRHSVDEIRVVRRSEGAIGAIFTFIALPILEFGRWLAQNIRKLNIPLILMDRVLEAPFKLLIDVSEEWFTFVRDRREEIV